jgi:hypothetical protein
MLVLVPLLLCARELAEPTFNPNPLRDGSEDTVGVNDVNVIVGVVGVDVGGVVIVVDIIVVVVGVGVSVGVDVVRSNSHSPPSIRAACAKLLKTPWEL